MAATICSFDRCTNQAVAEFMDDVPFDVVGVVVLMGPYPICQEHLDQVGRAFVEIRYPDGRVHQIREPGEPIPPR